MLPLQDRLCYTLVAEVLQKIDFHLLEIRSVRFLSDYPWQSGKKLRPITFLLCYLSVLVQRTSRPKMDGRESRLAAAIELLHEASLVHDDIVDRSTVRRGKPTMQVLHGESLALLIGDYMVFRGLKLVLDAASSREDILLAQELADTGLAIAQGEADQLDRYLRRFEPENRMSMDNYIGVIGKKTAAFFAGCAEAGAAMGGADRPLRAAYRDFGMSMGLAFQMIDDLMDVLGDPNKAAKTLRNNIAEGTVTLPMIHAWRLYPDDPLLKKLAFGENTNRREQSRVHKILSRPEVIERSRATMNEYAEQARSHLARLPSSIYRVGLADLLDYVLCCPWGGLEQQLAGGTAKKQRGEARAEREGSGG
jgi:geranylgeranyl pyrophosphate synthase